MVSCVQCSGHVASTGRAKTAVNSAAHSALHSVLDRCLCSGRQIRQWHHCNTSAAKLARMLGCMQGCQIQQKEQLAKSAASLKTCVMQKAIGP